MLLQVCKLCLSTRMARAWSALPEVLVEPKSCYGHIAMMMRKQVCSLHRLHLPPASYRLGMLGFCDNESWCLTGIYWLRRALEAFAARQKKVVAVIEAESGPFNNTNKPVIPDENTSQRTSFIPRTIKSRRKMMHTCFSL